MRERIRDRVSEGRGGGERAFVSLVIHASFFDMPDESGERAQITMPGIGVRVLQSYQCR